MSGTITPSPAAPFATTAFADTEKADIRRFAGYPVYGAGEAGFQSWRFFTAYGLLEYRMNNFAPAEYANIRYLLTQLYTLEAAVWGAGNLLGNNVAGPWQRNTNEIQDRERLFRLHRCRLAQICGVPPGPDLERSIGQRVI